MSEAGATVGYAIILFVVFGLGIRRGRAKPPKMRCSLCHRALESVQRQEPLP